MAGTTLTIGLVVSDSFHVALTCHCPPPLLPRSQASHHKSRLAADHVPPLLCALTGAVRRHWPHGHGHRQEAPSHVKPPPQSRGATATPGVSAALEQVGHATSPRPHQLTTVYVAANIYKLPRTSRGWGSECTTPLASYGFLSKIPPCVKVGLRRRPQLKRSLCPWYTDTP